MELEIVKNTDWEILTDDGFKSFDAVKRTKSKTIILTFSDGTILNCTHSHLIKLSSGEFKEANLIQIGCLLSTNVFLVGKEEHTEELYVYDCLGVKDTNSYITNGVVSHNCAFVDNWDEFYTSVYPTISSGKKTKMLFTSTANGLNHFYKFWVEAKEGRNGFAWVEVPWYKVDGRDEEWKQDTLASMNFDYEKFAQEFENEFLGSSGTLISGSALKVMVHKEPIYKKDGFNQYVIPDKSKAYVILCDVSRGKGLDYSAFSVIDVSVMPYVQVATYKSNVITPTDYAFIINKIGLLYNTASVLIELNDIGAQVADILFDDYDYDNLLFTMTEKGRNGKSLCGGGSNADRGVRTTTAVKAKGCSILKLLIEQQQLIINDFDTINELSRFSKKGKSYEAEDSSHDDMVMGLVLFSWMTTQPYFSNITDINTLHNLRDEDAWDDFVPFGYILDGSESDIEVDNEGRVWMHTDAWHMNY